MNILSSYVKSKVQKVLSNFLEDSDQGELSLDLATEELVLKNVYLKASAINNYLLELPFEVVSGSVVTLILKIPWTSLFTSPFEIFIDQPTVDLALKDTSKENLFSKEKALEKLFEMFKSHVKHLIKADQQEGSWEVIRNIQQKIIDNLQIKVNHLIVRLECPTIITNPVFQLSMTEFDFYTTDDGYRNPAFFDRNLEMYRNVPISKLLKMTDLIFTIGDNSHPVKKVGLLESVVAKKNEKSQNDVFKFSLEIHGKIKTSNEDKSPEPKYFASINILTFKVMFSERQIDHAVKLMDSVKEFSRKLFYFYNFKLQKPHSRIENKESLGLDRLGYSVLIKRWWFYSITLVLKDLYVKKTENVWMHFLNRKRSVQTAKLPQFILVPFREPLRQIVQQLIDNDWNAEGILKNSQQVFDLETILLSLPEAQLKLLIKQSCGDIISREKEKRKNKSFMLNLLSRVGLYKPKPNLSELRRIIEENVVEDNLIEHNYTLKLEVKFVSWRIHVVTDYNSVFMIETKNFSMVVDQFLDASDIVFSFKRFSFGMQGQTRRHEICFSQDNDGEFIKAKISILNVVKIQKTNVDLKMLPLIIEVRKEIFDEIYLFMKARNSKRAPNTIDDKEIPITVLNFERALKNIKSDVDINLDLSSPIIRLLLDEREKTILTFYSGNLRANIGFLNSEKRNKYSCSLDNMQIVYTLHGSNHSIMDMSVFVRSATAGISTLTLELISKRIVFNFWPSIINDMKNNVLSFFAKNIQKATDIPPTALKMFSVKYYRGDVNSHDDRQPPKDAVDRSLSASVIFYDNKSISIWNEGSLFLFTKIRELKFTYFVHKGLYILKVS